jgi:hypothetical protein
MPRSGWLLFCFVIGCGLQQADAQATCRPAICYVSTFCKANDTLLTTFQNWARYFELGGFRALC